MSKSSAPKSLWSSRLKGIYRAMKASIISTAGRGDDGMKINARVFQKMVTHAMLILDQLDKSRSEIILVSGGSAWADHVAVRLFLDSFVLDEPFAGLHLFLPCQVTKINKQFVFETTSQAGRRLIDFHEKFNSKMGLTFNSFADLFVARALGASFDCSSNGFHARNSLVARCDVLIAYAWGEDVNQPKEGGTLDTWNQSLAAAVKLHIPLGTLNDAISHPQRITIANSGNIRLPWSVEPQGEWKQKRKHCEDDEDSSNNKQRARSSRPTTER